VNLQLLTATPEFLAAVVEPFAESMHKIAAPVLYFLWKPGTFTHSFTYIGLMELKYKEKS